MTTTRIGGPGINLPINYPVKLPPGVIGAPNSVILGAGPISLSAGAAFHIPPGQWMVSPGPYSLLQTKDPVLGIWRQAETAVSGPNYVTSDGNNFRVVNLSGCAQGALITNVGSGYTSAPVVTASAGGSTWTAIVGGAVSATVTTVTAGTLYTFPPIVLISPPPAGGVQATATCALTSDGVGTVTVVNQGAGYFSAPTITFINDPRDTTGSGAAATTALTGSGTITAVYCTGRGTPLTAVPTLTFSGGGGASAAATTVMCFAATGLTVGTAGVAYGNAQPFMVITGGGVVPGTAGAVVNPSLDKGLMTPRQANFTGVTTAGGAITATGLITNDAGLFEAVPTGFVLPGGSGLPTTTGIVTITVGGVTDTSLLYPI